MLSLENLKNYLKVLHNFERQKAVPHPVVAPQNYQANAALFVYFSDNQTSFNAQRMFTRLLGTFLYLKKPHFDILQNLPPKSNQSASL